MTIYQKTTNNAALLVGHDIPLPSWHSSVNHALRHFVQSTVLLILIAVSPVTVAMVIIDPDGIGATSVFVTGSQGASLISNPNTTGTIHVGNPFTTFGNTTGTVVINASSAGNGITAISGSGLNVGRENGADGEMRIIGNGSANSASVTINNGNGNGARIGEGGEGRLEVRQGGALLSNDFISFGGNSGFGDRGTATVIIDGANSVIRSIDESGSSTSGGRVVIPFGVADTQVSVSNGGAIEALDQNPTNFHFGSVFIGNFSRDQSINANVAVTDENSRITAQHQLILSNNFGNAQLEVLNGARAEVTDPLVFDGFPQDPSLRVSSIDGNVRMRVSGVSGNGTASTVDVVGDIIIGGTIGISGFTSAGEPRVGINQPSAVGEQITDREGNPLFNPDGSPILAIAHPLFGPWFPTSDFRLASTGHATVENGGLLISGGDIIIGSSINDPSLTLLAPFSGNESTLTVRNGGEVVSNNIIIEEFGRLQGSGGHVIANVLLDGGVLAAGASTGTMTIDGDLIANNGILELEIGTTGQDLLDVNGDVILGSGLVIDLFIDTMLTDLLSIESFFTGYNSFNIEAGFDPLTDIHLFAGANSGFVAGDNLRIGLGGQEFLLSFNQTSTVPTPGILALMILGLGALSLSRRRTGQSV